MCLHYPFRTRLEEWGFDRNLEIRTYLLGEQIKLMIFQLSHIFYKFNKHQSVFVIEFVECHRSNKLYHVVS